MSKALVLNPPRTSLSSLPYAKRDLECIGTRTEPSYPITLNSLATLLSKANYDVTVYDLLFSTDMTMYQKTLNNRYDILVIVAAPFDIFTIKYIIRNVYARYKYLIFTPFTFELDEINDLLDLLERKYGVIVVKEQNPLEVIAKELGVNCQGLECLDWDFKKPNANMKRYSKYYDNGEFRPITGLGCPFSCTFCPLRRTNVYLMRHDEIVNKILLKAAKLDIKTIYLGENNFTINRHRVFKLTEITTKLRDEGLIKGLKFHIETRPDLIDDKIAKALKQLGVVRVRLGVESGDDNVLNNVKKGFSVDKAIRACEILKAYNINIELYLVAGLPGETLKSYYMTLELIKACKPDYIGVSVFMPVPGTPAFNEVVENNWIRPDAQTVDFLFIADRAAAYPVVSYPHMSWKAIVDMRKWLLKQVFKSSWYVLHRIRKQGLVYYVLHPRRVVNYIKRLTT